MLAAAIMNAMAKRKDTSGPEQSSRSPVKDSDSQTSPRKEGQLLETVSKLSRSISKSNQNSPPRSPETSSRLLDAKKELQEFQQHNETPREPEIRNNALILRDYKQFSPAPDDSIQSIKIEANDQKQGVLETISVASSEQPKEKSSGFTALQNVRKKITLSNLFLNRTRSSSTWDSSMGPKIKWTLKKEIKTMKDAEYIYESIKEFSFFSQFMDQTLEETEEIAILQLCRSMRYEFVAGGQYVFKEGDPSNDKFYIILNGIASVVLKKDSNIFMQENIEDSNKALELVQTEPIKEKKVEKSEDKHAKTANTIRKISLFARSIAKFSVISKKKHKDDLGEQIEQEEQNKNQVSKFKEAAKKALEDDNQNKQAERRSKSQRRTLKKPETISQLSTELGKINKQLKKGEAFGERALTSKDAKRNASILTNTDCEFIILMKQDYMSIMGRYNKENRNKMDFLKKHLPYVNKISSASVLQDYLYIFHDAHSHRGRTIISEEEKGDRVYILVSGQIKLEKKIHYHNPFEMNKIHKKVFIADAAAPTIFGEEILFDPQYQDKYKYTVKVESQEVKLYYCYVDALRMRFPKETQAALREHYIIKDKFRTQRYEFLKKADKQIASMQKTQSPAEMVVDFRYRDIVNFVSKSCRSTLINKFRAAPDELLDTENESSPQEIEEKKKFFENFNRNLEKIRLQVLQETQKTVDSIDRAEPQMKVSKSLSPKVQIESFFHQRTSYGEIKSPALRLQAIEDMPKLRAAFSKIPSRGLFTSDLSDDGSLRSHDAELKIKERGTIENPTMLRAVSENPSPMKLPNNQPRLRRNAVFVEILSDSLGQPNEIQNLTYRQTLIPTDNAEKAPISSKRQYIIRGAKKVQTQEELEQNMRNFEQKLIKITEENLVNGGRLLITDDEMQGISSRRRLASLGLLGTTQSQPGSPNSKNSPALLSPRTPFQTTTRKFLSHNPSPRTKITERLDTEKERKVASQHLTKRLVSSLNIKKNSDMMKTLNGFSQAMSGSKKLTPKNEFNFQTPKPEEIKTPKYEKSELRQLDIKSSKEDTNSPEFEMALPSADINTLRIDIKRQLFMKLSSDREFEVPQQLKLEILQSPNSSLLNIVAITGRKSTNLITESEISPDKFKSTWYGLQTPTANLINRQNERVALNSQKKTREINKKNAIRPLNLDHEKLQGHRFTSTVPSE